MTKCPAQILMLMVSSKYEDGEKWVLISWQFQIDSYTAHPSLNNELSLTNKIAEAIWPYFVYIL